METRKYTYHYGLLSLWIQIAINSASLLIRDHRNSRIIDCLYHEILKNLEKSKGNYT